MNAGETVKFLRDHTISELFIIPDEVVIIIREVNSILCTPQEECHYLTYTGLEQFILQLAVHISRKFFYKRRKSKTLIQVIERLLKRMNIEKEENSPERRAIAIRPLNFDFISQNKSLSPIRKNQKVQNILRLEEDDLSVSVGLDDLTRMNINKTFEDKRNTKIIDKITKDREYYLSEKKKEQERQK